MKKQKHIDTSSAHKKGKTKYFLSEKQQANIILAARGCSDCNAAKRLVKKLDKKYKLNA